jgi:hypothetical protein
MPDTLIDHACVLECMHRKPPPTLGPVSLEDVDMSEGVDCHGQLSIEEYFGK